jgi:hypothetical protein
MALLKELGHNGGPSVLSRPVASAWIEHYLSLRTADSLESLGLHAGQRVHIDRRFKDPVTGEITGFGDEGIVSTISSTGLVYFRGGSGKRAWPGNIRLP